MLRKFFFICRKCWDELIESGETTFEQSTRCNVHHENGIFTFMCFHCGTEETYTPHVLKRKPTIKELRLLKEKESIQQQLDALRN